LLKYLPILRIRILQKRIFVISGTLFSYLIAVDKLVLIVAGGTGLKLIKDSLLEVADASWLEVVEVNRLGDPEVNFPVDAVEGGEKKADLYMKKVKCLIQWWKAG
jgi:hypothetical protein